MKRPLDTVFGRLALLILGLIVLVQLTSMLLVDRSQLQLNAMRVTRIVKAAVQIRRIDPAKAPMAAAALGIEYVDLNGPAAALCSAGCGDTNGPLERTLRAGLPVGTHVRTTSVGAVQVRVAGAPFEVIVPDAIVPVDRIAWVSILTLGFAIAVAIFGAWQVNRPIRELARAAREFRIGRRRNEVALRGPRELRELIGDFNDMLRELSDAERERELMIAGVAHDLRAPITRIQVRADLLTRDNQRAAFLRDTESMARIVTQFLDFAREDRDKDASAAVAVDTYCRRHYMEAGMAGEHRADALVRLDLQAGARFRLPAVDLDRILSNLVGNALTYGEPPVIVSTTAQGGRYQLVVRDHGPGVPELRLDAIVRPFVRLDEARGGDAHCGLGLAIVRRLVRENGGALGVANAPDGGFVATMTFAERPRTDL